MTSISDPLTINKENTILYLTDFPSSYKTSEQDIKIFLNSFSESILEIKEDKVFPLSYKVFFRDYSAANKCRKEMNLKKIKNKSIRIMWAEKDTKILHNVKNNLFFKGIPKNISPRNVYEYFSQFGDISSLKMTEDDNGIHYGYGYVTFYNDEDTKKAMDNTKDKKIEKFEGVIIDISFFQKKQERFDSNSLGNSNKQKLYITNLPHDFTTSQLNSLCKEYGTVQSCNIFIDNNNKNFGIVKFSSEKEAEEIRSKLDGKEIEGLKLNVQLYQTKKEKNLGCNLHIRNIPLIAKEEDLIKIFSKYGKVISVKIEKEIKDNKVINKGFGYLSFDNAESADKALNDLNGKYLPGFESWSRTLIIELFLSKKERQLKENLENNNEFNLLNYFSYNNGQENNNNFNNYNNINNFNNNNIGKIFNFNNINININQYNNNIPYINNMNNINQNTNSNINNINITNNQFNFQGTPPPPPPSNFFFNFNNFNQFFNNYNYNYQFHYSNKKRRKNFNNKNNDIDWSKFHNLKTKEEKKEFLGEIIFKKIEENEIIKKRNIKKEQIGKITGMIIELPSINEVIEVIEKEEVLNDRIEEGLKLMQEMSDDDDNEEDAEFN